MKFFVPSIGSIIQVNSASSLSFPNSSPKNPCKGNAFLMVEIIISTIKKAFPLHGFLGEEFGKDKEDAEFTWIIDPIDGTKNFIHGLSFFGTVLSLKYQGKVILGISNMPALGELLYASKDEKTTLNGKSTHVSQIQKLEDSFVNFNPSKFDTPRFLNIVKTVDRRVTNMRGFGDI